LDLQHFLPGQFFQIAPAELTHDLIGCRHDGAAVGGMRLDHLARPFRIEQVGETFRSVLRPHQTGVVAERGKPHARRHPRSTRIIELSGIVPSHLLGKIGNEPTAALPDDEMRGIRAIHQVDSVNAAFHLLSDALEHPFRSGAFHSHADVGVFGLERLPELLRDREVHGGIEGEPAFLPRGLDQSRRNCGRLDRHRLRAGKPHETARSGQAAGNNRGGRLQRIAPGNSTIMPAPRIAPEEFSHDRSVSHRLFLIELTRRKSCYSAPLSLRSSSRRPRDHPSSS
jgi:hypothetical protein